MPCILHILHLRSFFPGIHSVHICRPEPSIYRQLLSLLSSLTWSQGLMKDFSTPAEWRRVKKTKKHLQSMWGLEFNHVSPGTRLRLFRNAISVSL